MDSAERPRLSIIVPAYNEERWLGACLESLLAQTETRFELIVVDNNSSDGTLGIARRYCKEVLREPRKGYHHAVRRGVQASQGVFVAVCDADTRYDSDWVRTLYRLLDERAADGRLVGVYGSVDFHDGGLVYRNLVRFFCFSVFMRLMLLAGIHVCNGFNFAFRRDAFDQVGGYDARTYDKVGLDIDLGRRLQAVGRLEFVPKLKARTSMRRIVDGGLWNFVTVNLHLYWSLLRKRKPSVSYDDYNRK
jgi:glycosyltransferase involved in cell wall biosynthesis